MSLDDVVDLQISAESAAPTRQGFGTPLIMAVHNVFPDLLAEFGTPKEMTDAGFALTSPAYRLANVVFSQEPRPSRILIGKRNNSYTQTVTLIPLKTTQGYHYKFTLVDPAGVSTAIDYTVPGSATSTTIAAALAALLDPVTDVTATAASGVITMTCVAGELFNLQGLPSPSILEVKDTTTDPGIAADLTTIEGEDADTWYAVLFDHSSKLSGIALAAWIESRRKLALLNTSDSEILKTNVTNDLCSTLKGSNYARTATLFAASEMLCYSAAGWAGRMLPTDPGYATWGFKTIKGVPTDKFTSGQVTAMKAKNCNFYLNKGGKSVTMQGLSAAGEYLDVTHGTDALYARIQEDVFGTIQAADKIPFTDSGADRIRSTLSAALESFRKPKAPGGPTFLNPEKSPIITIPKVADVSDSDKQDRTLPDITFEDYMAGAIQGVKITGRLTF
jgi:hypothetical protein